MKIIFLFLLVSITSVHSQDLFSLYKNIIPPQVLENSDNRNQVNAMIVKLADYNPKLIYYYIEYLKLMAIGSENAANAKQYFDYVRNEYHKQIQEWIKKENSLISGTNIPQMQKHFLKDYFNSLDKSYSDKISSVEPLYEINENYRDYLVYLFYNKKYSDYEAGITYKKMINEILSEKANSIKNSYNNTVNLTEEDLDKYYETAKSNPFLFSGNTFDLITKPIPFRLSEILIKLTAHRFNQKNSLFAFASFDFYAYDKNETFTRIDESTPEFIANAIKINRSSPSIGIGGNIKLQENKLKFSAVNFNLALGYFRWFSPVAISSEGQPFFRVIWNNISNKVNPNYTATTNYYTFTSYLNASTPILYLTSDISLEAGAYMKYIYSDYKLFLSRNDEYYQEYHSFPENLLVKYDRREVKYKSSRFGVYPSLGIKYELSDRFRILLMSSTEYYYPQLNILYHYGLK